MDSLVIDMCSAHYYVLVVGILKTVVLGHALCNPFLEDTSQFVIFDEIRNILHAKR